MKKKIVFFGDSNSKISTDLFKQLIQDLSGFNFELVAIVDTKTSKSPQFFYIFFWYLIKKIFNPRIKYNLNFFLPFTWYKKNIPLIKTRNINSPNFLEQIKKINPDYAFLMGCPQILKKELIEHFTLIINYHNSFLPQFRGLNATAWSMYFNEEETGYTYHYINHALDDGNILLQEKFKIDYSKTVFEVEDQKTNLARKQIKNLLKKIEKKELGVSQKGEISYFGQKEQENLITFKRLNQKDFDQVKKIISIFGAVKLVKPTETVYITNINNEEITRIAFLPRKLFYFLKFIKKSLCRK